MFRQNFHSGLIFCVLALPLILMATIPVSAKETSTTEEVHAWEYEVNIPENLPGDLSDLLEQSSALLQLKEKPPISFAGLQRRIEEDEEGFRKVLRSEGYYASLIQAKVNRTAHPLGVTFQVEAGPQYKISAYRVQYHYLQTLPPPVDLVALTIQQGMAARSEPILTSQKQVISQMTNMGFPFAKIKEQKAVVDYERQSMDVTLILETGPYIQLGDLKLAGLTDVNAEHMRRLSGWVPNKTYRKADLEKLRRV